MEANPELKKKFEKEVKTNPEADVREFLNKNGKEEEFDKFVAKEEKKIELQQFVNSNAELKDKFE